MRYLLFTILLLFQLVSFAQMTQEEYIKTYSEFAVREMKRSGVPASITLSQGILESANGNSYLSTEGNNHFGIKCGSKWTGPKIYSDDDAKNECFRKYETAEESYRDHSDFLLNNTRYQFLFKLDITDYKGWCHGLKKAGYATSPTYAERLISLIERHELYKFDSGTYQYKDNNPVAENTTNEGERGGGRQTTHSGKDNFYVNMNELDILTLNNTPYIIVDQNTDVRTLAKQINLMPWQIQNYNNIDKYASVNEGDIIYMKPKKNRAAKGSETHVLQEGETMWDVSQKYAVKLKKLYKKNNLEFGTEPPAGTRLNLRANKRR